MQEFHYYTNGDSRVVEVATFGMIEVMTLEGMRTERGVTSISGQMRILPVESSTTQTIITKDGNVADIKIDVHPRSAWINYYDLPIKEGWQEVTKEQYMSFSTKTPTAATIEVKTDPSKLPAPKPRKPKGV